MSTFNIFFLLIIIIAIIPPTKSKVTNTINRKQSTSSLKDMYISFSLGYLTMLKFLSETVIIFAELLVVLIGVLFSSEGVGPGVKLSNSFWNNTSF